MLKTYIIVEDAGDVRIVKEFQVEGKDEEECLEEAQEELRIFKEALVLKED